MEDGVYHIGEVAARVGLSLRTVRYYESIGLVLPSGRSEGGFRLYTEADVQRLRLVRALRPADLSTDELRELLGLREQLAMPTQGGTEGGPDEAAAAGGRLDALLSLVGERLRVQRERLIAAELAVELLRAIGGTRGHRP